jgi:hypothetical protein
VTYPVLFLSLQILSSFHPSTNALPISPTELAAIEALKLAFNVFARYRSRSQEQHLPARQTQGRTLLWDASQEFEEQPLQGMNGHHGEEEEAAAASDIAERGVGQETPDVALSIRAGLVVAFASVVWASSTYIVRLFLFPSHRPDQSQREAFF